MRSVRGFHADQTPRQIGEEPGYRIATQRLSHDDFSEAVDAMNLEHILRKVQTYSNDLHDFLLCCSWRSRFHLAWRAGSIPLAPGWQELSSRFAALVGAAMCSAF